MTKLIDLGEREILRKIIPKFATAAGDDCACMPFFGGELIATTDPVPPPAALSIGGDPDLFWMGWLLVTINVSDLAAAGASPVGFLSAIECEADRTVSDFERLLEGVKAGCEEAAIPYVGGNIREASKLSAVGIALGSCEHNRSLRRTGARDGDLVVSFGQGGIFWRDAIRILAGRAVASKDISPIFKPRSQIGVMHHFAKLGLINAAMDNSDGLLPSLSELSAKNKLGICIDLETLTVPGLSNEEKVDSARLWLGWGDWNVIGCISEDNREPLMRAARAVDATVHIIGRVSNRYEGVVLKRKDDIASAPRLESERFSRDSWMLLGIKEYVRMLREVTIP